MMLGLCDGVAGKILSAAQENDAYFFDYLDANHAILAGSLSFPGRKSGSGSSPGAPFTPCPQLCSPSSRIPSKRQDARKLKST